MLLVLLTANLGSGMASAAVAPQAASGISLNGVVSDPSGKPISGAKVILKWKAGEKAATSNDKGEYLITGLSAADYKLTATANGYDLFESEVSLPAGLEGLQIDVPMQPLPGATQTGIAPALEPDNGPAHPKQPPAPEPAAAPQVAKVPGASLNGIVTDQTGAVIPQATVTVTSGSTNQTATSNERGQYLVQGLGQGVFKLKVSAQGFAAFETDVTLAADQSLEIDASLQPPSAVENVDVVGSGPGQVETGSAHIEGTITSKEVVSQPLNGRNFTQLIALTPGVSNQTGQDEAKVGVAGSVKYSVNGGRVEYNNFDVDGGDVLNAGLNGGESTLVVYPSLDAIQEVKVLTSNYGAMYGRTASGSVMVTTKSGTPKWHGNAYDFVRNEFFNARNYFDQTTKAPLYRRQDFGGTIGGPLSIPGVFNTKKDKTFIFWSEEFRLEKSPQGPGGSTDFNQAVPTLLQRPHNCVDPGNGQAFICGDFSEVCPVSVGSPTPFSRATYPDCPAGFGTFSNGSTFASNLVPVRTNLVNNPNPSVPELLSATGLIPLPNSTIGCNSNLAGKLDNNGVAIVPCYNAVISPSTYWREELFRVDHNFSQSVRASFRYIHDSWDTSVVTPQWGYIQNSFPTVQNRLNGPGLNMVARLTDTLTPSLLNEFVVSYTDAKITLANQAGPGATLGRPAGLNLGYIFNNGFGGKAPGVVIGGTNSAYGGNGFAVDPSYVPWEHTNPTYGVTDNISKQIKKHTLQFGVQVDISRRNETNGAIGAATGDLQGLLYFSNQNSQATTGNAYADSLVQNSSGTNPIKAFQQDSNQLRYHNNYWIAEPYVQDDWHITSRLTFNLGVRLSLFGNYNSSGGNVYNWVASKFDKNLANTIQLAPIAAQSQIPGGYLELLDGTPITINPNNPLSGLNPVITNGLVQCGKNGVAPGCMSSHIFNPAPRVGFAWDPKGDGRTSIRAGYGLFFEHGTAKEANTGSLEGSAPNVLTMNQPFPFSYQKIGQDSNGDQVAFPLDVTSIPTKTKWPYVQQWSLSVQRQLPKDTVATLAYVGSKGTHLTAELQVNQLPVPPTGPDNGIFPNGNPFVKGQPITVQNCTPVGNNGDIFQVGNNLVTSSQPAWNNLAAACWGVQGLNSPLLLVNPDNLRPYRGLHRILSLQNIADSQYHALQATIRHSHGPVTVGASYSYSHSLDDSSDRSDTNFVNSADITQNWASSSFDQRHLLNVSYIYNLPHLSRLLDGWAQNRDKGDSDETTGTPARDRSDSPFLHALFDGWQISGITVFQSGTPFSIINGGSNTEVSVVDNAGVANAAGVGSYPDIVKPNSVVPVGSKNSSSIGPLLLNPADFAAPQGLTFGNTRRNFVNNPNRWNIDATLQKNFKVGERGNFEFRAEAFNLLNHTQFRIFNPNLGNTANNTINCYGSAAANYSAAGGGGVDCLTGSALLHPVDAHRPRTIQFGLKYSF